MIQIAVAFTEHSEADKHGQGRVQSPAVGGAVEVDRDLGICRCRPHLGDKLIDEELGLASSEGRDRQAQQGVL